MVEREYNPLAQWFPTYGTRTTSGSEGLPGGTRETSSLRIGFCF